jgi:hypothetical protein
MKQNRKRIREIMRGGEKESFFDEIKKSPHYIELSKRLGSFFWRFGMALVVGMLTVVGGYLTELESKEVGVLLVIYVINEITKYINKQEVK